MGSGQMWNEGMREKWEVGKWANLEVREVCEVGLPYLERSRKGGKNQGNGQMVAAPGSAPSTDATSQSEAEAALLFAEKSVLSPLSSVFCLLH